MATKTVVRQSRVIGHDLPADWRLVDYDTRTASYIYAAPPVPPSAAKRFFRTVGDVLTTLGIVATLALSAPIWMPLSYKAYRRRARSGTLYLRYWDDGHRPQFDPLTFYDNWVYVGRDPNNHRCHRWVPEEIAWIIMIKQWWQRRLRDCRRWLIHRGWMSCAEGALFSTAKWRPLRDGGKLVRWCGAPARMVMRGRLWVVYDCQTGNILESLTGNPNVLDQPREGFWSWR